MKSIKARAANKRGFLKEANTAVSFHKSAFASLVRSCLAVNTFIKKVLKWEPNTKLDKGLAETYAWIKQQYKKRKAGERVGVG